MASRDEVSTLPTLSGGRMKKADLHQVMALRQSIRSAPATNAGAHGRVFGFDHGWGFDRFVMTSPSQRLYDAQRLVNTNKVDGVMTGDCQPSADLADATTLCDGNQELYERIEQLERQGAALREFINTISDDLLEAKSSKARQQVEYAKERQDLVDELHSLRSEYSKQLQKLQAANAREQSLLDERNKLQKSIAELEEESRQKDAWLDELAATVLRAGVANAAGDVQHGQGGT